MPERTRDWRLNTLAVHAGEPRPQVDGAVVMPIFQSATYLTEEVEGYDSIRYVRLNNTPNHEATAAKVAALERMEAALLTASGLAAVSATLSSLLEAGDHLIAQDCLYGGTRELLTEQAPRAGVEVTFVSLDEPGDWERALRERTRAFYCESVTNPRMEIGRLDEVAAFARAHGLKSVIDNTFPTPASFRPGTLGFDLVVHSGTKYLGGHADVVAGAICGSAEDVLSVKHRLNLTGACLDPHACYLLNRGLKTLGLRVRAACESAGRLARLLDDHDGVQLVLYPGLPGDPSHERAERWLDRPGAMLSFVPKGGVAAAERILSRLTIPILAPSLGGVETLVSRPCRTSHAGLTARERTDLGIPDEMIRVSVGIEDGDDLLKDFERALEG